MLNLTRLHLGIAHESQFQGLGIRRALEEELYWHLKDIGHLLQPAGPHAVGAVLVFLHLLEGEAECGTQLFLAHCKHLAAHAHAAADVLVDGVRGLLRGNCKRTAMADRSLKLLSKNVSTTGSIVGCIRLS